MSDRNNRGQVLPYLASMICVLVLCWAMLVNIARLLKDRMVLQNAADNAALSVAVHKARVLNALGKTNYLIACAMYGGERGLLSYHGYGATFSPAGVPVGVVPVAFWPLGGFLPGGYDPAGPFAVDDQRKVTGMFDLLAGGGIAHVAAARSTVRGLVALQDALVSQFELNVPVQLLASDIGRRQEMNARGAYTGADSVIVVRGVSLGLARNTNGVVYHRSRKLNGLAAESAKLLVNALLAANGIPVMARNVFESEHWAEDRKSWLYACRREFDRDQKIVVIARKEGASASNAGYPLLGSWFGIAWPSITAVSAAGVYNTKGPMFPVEQKGQPSNRISRVIREYKKAEDGGWDAHLVPVGSPFRH